MTAYYNEIDPYAAQWLRNLIAAGHIADGVVDTRSIKEVQPYDLREFTQCHFFAGIGVWSRALRLAGWPDERPVWTGSCPCQPFSVAGRAGGFADERHLWPHFHHLIRECQPGVVFGEQVASKDGLSWLDLVQADLEGENYAFGAVDLCAAGIGAPHIRQRLYWVADTDGQRHGSARNAAWSGDAGRNVKAGGLGNDDDDAGLEGLRRGHQAEGGRVGSVRSVTEAGESGWLEYCACDGREQRRAEPGGRCLACGCSTGGVGHTKLYGQPAPRQLGEPQGEGRVLELEGPGVVRPAGSTNGHWRDADWLFCRDGKWRPVEPGSFPLVDGAPARVGRLRAYGNAIVPQVAAEVIRAYADVTGLPPAQTVELLPKPAGGRSELT